MQKTYEFYPNHAQFLLSSFIPCTSQLCFTKELIGKCFISASVGVVFGAICSLIVNFTLAEISLSSFFSFYFGILFVFIGGLILWRISSNESEDSQSKKLKLVFFSVLIVLSGILCIVLEKNWFVDTTIIAKIALYSLLATSIAFSLTFSFLDLVNFILGFFVNNASKYTVESRMQVNIILIVALSMGCIFGLIFGVLDLHDSIAYHVRLSLLREQPFCYPIGALFGGIAGFGNEYFRNIEVLAKSHKRSFDGDM